MPLIAAVPWPGSAKARVGDRQRKKPAVRSPGKATRFLELGDVAEELNISLTQTFALVRSGGLQAIRIGGRGLWRVERDRLEAYIEQCYPDTKAFVALRPLPQKGQHTDNDGGGELGDLAEAADP